MKKRLILLAAAAFVLATPAMSAETPKRGGTLTAIVQPEPVTLTPSSNTATPTQIVAGNIFDGLVYYDPELKPQPSLATSWNVAEDGLTISFNLRKGVKWHDGKPFSSADVKWSLENVWKTIHPRNKAIFENVSRIDTPDDVTVTLHLSKPSSPILSVLNGVGAPILPKHLYEGTDILNNPYNNKPVGTGAFTFKEWKKGEYIQLERNPDYWDPAKPYLDKIIYRIIPDAAARAAAIEKGDVQLALFNPVSFREVERLPKLPSLKIETRGYEWLSPVLYLDFNVESQYLKDVRVRQAITHALDKDALAKVVWYGYGKPAVSPVPTTLAAFHDASVQKYPFDLKKAESLLDEAGFKRGADGVRFTLNHDFLPCGDDYKRTGEYMKQALKRVGIEVNIRAQDTAAFIKRIYVDRDFDIRVHTTVRFPIHRSASFANTGPAGSVRERHGRTDRVIAMRWSTD